MRESLRELFEVMNESVPKCQDAASALEYEKARTWLKRVMSAASKLYGRLDFLIEQEMDAKFVAEIDRALARSKMTHVLPMEGDSPLPFPTTGEPASAPRGKGKGTRKA